MKKITWIVLFLCGMTVALNAQTNAAPKQSSDNTEVQALAGNLSASIAGTEATDVAVANDDELASVVDAKASVSKDATAKKSAEKKPWKKWKDRTVAGKILVGVGMGIFIILCLLFGTVSVG